MITRYRVTVAIKKDNLSALVTFYASDLDHVNLFLEAVKEDYKVDTITHVITELPLDNV